MGDGRELAVEKHIRYIVTVEKVDRLSLGCELLDAAADSDWMLFAVAAAVMQKKDSFESLVMEHIRLNGAYWGLTTLDLLHKLHAVEADEFIEWIMSCYHPDSGISIQSESAAASSSSHPSERRSTFSTVTM
uniref:Prenyltransferase alpha-alpha toroid domain-containing protein n=1 Tax=Oryza nivara TaxID=4536 RepID=A0A0E0J9W5_ORYNI